MHHLRQHIRTAGRRAATEDQSQADAHQRTAENRAKHRVVRQRLQLQNINRQGKQHRRHQRADNEHMPHAAIAHDKQRDIQHVLIFPCWLRGTVLPAPGYFREPNHIIILILRCRYHIITE